MCVKDSDRGFSLNVELCYFRKWRSILVIMKIEGQHVSVLSRKHGYLFKN